MTDRFYRDLLPVDLAPAQVLAHRQHFHLLPSDWQVVVADIKNSTAAFRQGKYREINLLAASCVITALNLARAKDLDVPFIYGGDGATLAVPPGLAPSIIQNLAALSRLAQKYFKLELRVGSLTVSELETTGHLVKVAKVYIAPGYNQALFLDNGLAYAEALIKDNPAYQAAPAGGEVHPDLAGLQCRWSAIKGPHRGPEIMCLIVYTAEAAQHDQIYQSVLSEIEKIYGNFAARHPLRGRRLGYHFNWSQFAWESYALFGRFRLGYVLKLIAATTWHKFFPAPNEQHRLLAASDVIKTDGSLKTVIAGPAEHHQALLQYLEAREAAGELKFGHAIVNQSFVTCYVPQADKQINFLDGQGGGYIQAATELKLKLKR
jgi:hypothetical protein